MGDKPGVAATGPVPGPERDPPGPDAARDAEHRAFSPRSSGDIVLEFDGQWRVVDCNERAPQAYGWPRDRLLSLTLTDLAATGRSVSLAGLSADVGRHGQAVFESAHARSDGSTFPVEVTVYPAETHQGAGYRVTVRDTTERRLADEERRRHNRELEVFSRIVSVTAMSLDLPGVLDHALTGAIELTGLEGGTVCMVDSERGALQLAAAVNTSPETVADLTADVVKIGTCLCGSCAETGEPLILWDNASGSELATREATRREGIRFHAAFPLMVGGRCIGVLCIFARDARRPSERSLGLVQDLCGPIALAIENARLYRAEQDARAQAEAARAQADANREQLNRVFERVTDAFVALDKDWRYTYVNARAGEVFGRRPEDLIGKHIWTEFPEGVGQPFHLAYERAMREQQPLRFEDYYPPYDRWFENILYPSPDGLSIYFHDVTERKRVEAAIQRERDFSQGVLDSLPGVLYCYDEDLHFRTWNRNFERVTGYDADEIACMSPLDFFAGAEKALLASRIRDVFVHGMSDAEADFVSKDGTHTRYYFTGHVTELDGRRHLVGVGVDISATRAAQAALRESEERLRMALDAARMGTFDWDITNDRVSWTRRHEQLWGFEPGEFPGTLEAFSSRVHPDDADAVNAEMARSLAQCDQYVREFRVVWPDGSVHWVMGRGEYTYDDQGAPVRMNGVVVETTELREAERALAASEAHYRGLFEQAPDGVFLSDPEGRYQDVSAAGCDLLGYRLDELVGRTILDVIEPAEAGRLGPSIAQLNSGGVVQSEWRFVRKDGSGFLGEVTARQLPDGRLQAYVRDVTERRRAENEIRELNATLEERVRARTAELAAARDKAEEADRLKSAFLATMSHELRTPLNSVIGFTGILLQELAGPLNEEQNKQLTMVQGSARHLLALINDVLDLSKIEAGELRVSHEPFEVDAVLTRATGTVRPLAEKKGLALRLEVPEPIGAMVGDERRVEQILLNLLGNAVKFTERGEVVLRALALDQHPPTIRFAVRDTGIGIAPEDVASLFKPFRQLDAGLTRRHEGTGLGLAICWRLAELLGGEMGVTSSPGAGSEFTLSLPRGEEGA